MIDPRLLADTEGAEGCRLTAYRDTRGYWTVGYGHLLDQSIDWTGHEITQEAANALLALDLGERQVACRHLSEWPSLDTDCRQNAVVECVFNLGIGHWIDEFPHTRSCIKAQDWSGAHGALLDSPEWIQQVGLRRVERIAGYLLNGCYSPA